MIKQKSDPGQLEGTTPGTMRPPGISMSGFKVYLPAVFSFILLGAGLVMDYLAVGSFFGDWVRATWYLIAYIPVGWPVVMAGWKSIQKGNFFTEFLLMSIATLGAFALGEYPEGVAVMLFYAVGELFQNAAVTRARGNIRALLDVRPQTSMVYRDKKYTPVRPESVQIGEKVRVRVGEKVGLDGTLLSERASLNTAAISGESKPATLYRGDKLLAGSINLEGVIEFETTREFKDSSIARMLHLVQEASARKSKTELFIRKFAKVYTPIVVYLALGLALLPYFFVPDYVFRDWLYRALIFLVISCPCALVISIPLGYFGGLGAASRNGILFKGASFLDVVTRITTMVIDKTGTLTKGVFKIKHIKTFGISEQELMGYLVAMEKHSTHPIAGAILEYQPQLDGFEATEVMEVAGRGLTGIVNGKRVLVGNESLMASGQVSLPKETTVLAESLVMVAVDGTLKGYVVVADELKEDARDAIRQIRASGISNIIMLSGDKEAITRQLATDLGITKVQGALLPEDKLREVATLKRDPDAVVAFMGDGINDAPVLAASDVGIAMGGLGSDVAIEAADVIIQTDHPSKAARAIAIGRSTRQIVWQNIALAFGVKFAVLLLGAWGVATMWEAVFADVGVALLAILNAVRLQKMHWD